MSLGLTLKESRKQSNKSLRAIAKATGICDSTLSKYENDLKEITLPHLHTLSKFYQLNPIDLLLAAGYLTEYDVHDYYKNFDRFNGLSAEEASVVHRLIDLLERKQLKENVK